MRGLKSDLILPGGGLLIPGGFLGDGLVERVVSTTPQDTSVRYPATAAEWATAAGFNALTNYWRMVQEGVDVLVPDLEGSADLVPFAVTQGVADEALNSLCAQYASNGNKIGAALDTTLDTSDQSFLIWTVVRFLAPSMDGNLRAQFGKRGTVVGGFPGFENWTTPNSGANRSTIDNGPDAAEVHDLAKGSAWADTPAMFVLLVDRDADNWQNFAWQGGVGYQSAGRTINAYAPDLTNNGTFRFGSQDWSEVRPASMLQAAGGMIIGVDAEGFTLDNLEALAEWMRLP